MQGFVFGSVDCFANCLSFSKCYQDEFHNLNELSTTYVFGEFNLGQWIRSQRRCYKNGKLSAESEALLKEPGIVFE